MLVNIEAEDLTGKYVDPKLVVSIVPEDHKTLVFYGSEEKNHGEHYRFITVRNTPKEVAKIVNNSLLGVTPVGDK